MARTVDFSIKAFDTAPAIEAQLVDSAGAPVSLQNVTSVTFILSGTDKVAVLRQPAEILSSSTSIVRYRWQVGDTDVPGRYLAEWELEYDDQNIETFPNSAYMSVRILADLRGDTFTLSSSDTGSLAANSVSV